MTAISIPSAAWEVMTSSVIVASAGNDGRDDPTGGTDLLPLVIRDDPSTPGQDAHYLRYTGADAVDTPITVDASGMVTQDVAVRFERVQGTYDRGGSRTNRAEAFYLQGNPFL